MRIPLAVIVSLPLAGTAVADSVRTGTAVEDRSRAETTFVGVNPIGWLGGWFGFGVTHRVHDRAAIHVDAASVSNDFAHGWEVIAGVPLYVSGAFDGPFVEPALIARRARSGFFCDGGPECPSENLTGPALMLGWHWTYDPGFSVAAAVGGAYDVGDSVEPMLEIGAGIELTAYLRVGYAL